MENTFAFVTLDIMELERKENVLVSKEHNVKVCFTFLIYLKTDIVYTVQTVASVVIVQQGLRSKHRILFCGRFLYSVDPYYVHR